MKKDANLNLLRLFMYKFIYIALEDKKYECKI